MKSEEPDLSRDAKWAKLLSGACNPRKIVQIAPHNFTACVDSDGVAWQLIGGVEWFRLPPLPQGDAS